MNIYIGNKELKELYIGNSSIKEVYVGSELVRPIDWSPLKSTIIYYPLTTTDTTKNLGTLWNSYDLNNSGVSFTQQGGIFNGSSYLNTSINLPNASQYTIAFWVKPQKQSQFAPIIDDGDSNVSNDFWIECDLDNGIGIRCKSDSGWTYKKPSDWNSNTWYCVVLTMNSSGRFWYVNNTLLGSSSGASNVNTNYHYRLQIGRATDGVDAWGNFQGKIGRIVIDTSIWTQNERSDFYNKTKKYYNSDVITYKTIDFTSLSSLTGYTITKSGGGYTYALEQGQGLSFNYGGSGGLDESLFLQFPTSFYEGELQSVEIGADLNNLNDTIGIASLRSVGDYFSRLNIRDGLSVRANGYSSFNMSSLLQGGTNDVVVKMDFTTDGIYKANNNGYEQSVSSNASTFWKGLWNNGTLQMTFGGWGGITAKAYVKYIKIGVIL